MARLSIGQYAWENDEWTPPAGVLGSIDLQSHAQIVAATPGQPRGPLVVLSEEVPKGFTQLTDEDPRDAKINGRFRSIWQAKTGFRPTRETAIGCLAEQLTMGADPQNETSCGPLMPTHDLKLEIWLGRDCRVAEWFDMSHPHAATVRTVLRRQLSKAREESLAGKRINPLTRVVDLDYHRCEFDALCEKYAGCDPKGKAAMFSLMKPAEWDAAETLLKHNTQIFETFDTSNGTTLGPLLTWTELAGDMEIVSNQCGQVVAATASQSRADTDLSSSDTYAQFSHITRGDSATAGTFAVCRKDGTADITHYQAGLLDTGFGDSVRALKANSGSFSTLFTTAVSVSLPQTIRVVASGSSIMAYWNGVFVNSASDTTIASGLRAGIRMGIGTSVKKVVDTFEAGDQLLFSLLALTGVGN